MPSGIAAMYLFSCQIASLTSLGKADLLASITSLKGASENRASIRKSAREFPICGSTMGSDVISPPASVRLVVNSLNISKAMGSSTDIPCAANITIMPHIRDNVYMYCAANKRKRLCKNPAGGAKEFPVCRPFLEPVVLVATHIKLASADIHQFTLAHGSFEKSNSRC
ncbi:hypothetical protein P6U16_27050 (plasmid) [Rhizobium sp. 32-5/1]|uniref:hypothetical protein n=1 Tax=Rhizobium sp. 32-5/1 TaxID=3019602 RepID=UPI00240E9522|nr:hypothetical protein [Rhizobium sp. 32-5/1]WEZ86232.1 hypothetical protein P6U16_27050 [Rhizobium sp. 32-5/1]